MEAFLRDVRFGLRMLAKNPGFAAVAILTLALGVGANAAMFSVMDALLLRALPVSNPQELVEFVRLDPRGSMMTNLPYAIYDHLRENKTVLSGIFAFWEDTAHLRAGAGTERATVHEVSGSFFSTLGVKALLGRTIISSEENPGNQRQVAVLSYTFWSRRFGRDPSAVGATLVLDGKPFVVVGVMPPDFVGVDRGRIPDVWIPLAPKQAMDEVWVVGRLKPGVSLTQAHAQLDPLFGQALQSLKGEIQGWSSREQDAILAEKLIINRATRGTSGLRWQYWEYSSTLKILLAMTGLVLLISCVNLANLLMTRSAGRSREMSVRLAIGAPRGRILRQMLAEDLILAVLGGASGLLIAAWGHGLLVGFLVGDSAGAPLQFRLDSRVLAFSLAMAVLTALLSGILPAIRSARRSLATSMHGVSDARGATRLPFARKLLSAQVALSLALLVGAGLFVRTLENLAATDPGLARQNLILMSVDPSQSKQAKDRQDFWRQLTGRVTALPGVRSASLAGDAVFGNGGWNTGIWLRQPDGTERDAQVAANVAGPGFFETVGIPLLAGREFGEQDQSASAPVAVVNASFVKKFFGAENPIGKRFGDRGRGSVNRVAIVGIIADAKYGNLREHPEPMIYEPLYQNLEARSYQLHVRTAGDPAAAIAAIRHEVETWDPNLFLDDPRTINDVIRGLLQHDRMFAILASAFGLLAVALTAIGLYGVVSYEVAQRTGEVGIRLALGAKGRDVVGMFVREIFVVLALGGAIGLPAAAAAARLLRELLFGLEPIDPVTFAVAPVLLVAVALVASYIPARRATKVDPMVALRFE